MGLSNWPGERILPRDVTVAKNYLKEDELYQLNNIVEQYLIFAEGQAERRLPMKMKDWIEKVHGFLTLNDRDILKNAGKISKELASEQAMLEYEKFRLAQKLPINYESDFDRTIKQNMQRKHALTQETQE